MNFSYHRFRQTTRISFIFHLISKQTYKFDKLIDEHVNYSSLDNEKIFLLKILCLIFFFLKFKAFYNSKEKKISLTIRKKKKFY